VARGIGRGYPDTLAHLRNGARAALGRVSLNVRTAGERVERTANPKTSPARMPDENSHHAFSVQQPNALPDARPAPRTSPERLPTR